MRRGVLRTERHWTVRYGVAALAVALVFLIQSLLDPFTQGESPFLLLSTAVLVAAVVGGLGTGIFVTLLGALIGDYFFLSPVGTLVPPSATHGLRTILFVAQGLAISGIGAALVYVRQRAESNARQAREDRENLRFIAETSAELSSSLDYRATLGSVARLAVPTLADWCAVDILENGSISRLVVVHQDPEKVRWAHELQRRYPPDPDATHGVPQVLRSGSSEIYPEITDEVLAAIVRDEEHLRLMREVGLTSAMVVPLVARGRTLGALTLVCAESGRSYGSAELELAEELGRRAGLAIDNARLYDEAQEEIAERERAEDALRLSEERYRAVVQQAGEGIYLFDARTKQILETNPSFQRMLGHTPEELQRMKVYDLVPADPESVDRNVGRTLEQSRLLVGDRVYSRKDGSPVDLEVSGSVISYGDREVVCAVARDITERKRAERALREVREAERNRLARDLHDGALQDISYALAEAEVVRVISEDPDLDTRLNQIVESLRRGGRELRGAVLDLRLGEERNEPLYKQLGTLVDQNRRMDPNLDIRLEVGGLPSTHLGADAVELLRAVQEALTNVRRHAQARNARITVRFEGEDLVAEVSDDGRGFGPDTTPGVGFRSMKERTVALGGEIEVESEPGRGTQVRFRIPSGTLLGEVANARNAPSTNGDGNA